MNVLRVITIVLIGLVQVSTAQAGLTTAWETPQERSVENLGNAIRVKAAIGTPRPLSTASPTAPAVAPASHDLWSAAIPFEIRPDSETAELKTPELPGSASLFLSGIASLGAWHLVKRARGLRFSSIPDWYHLGAPERIGDSVAVDPVAGIGAMPLCLWESPSVNAQSRSYQRRPRNLRAGFSPQEVVSPAHPRGPPND